MVAVINWHYTSLLSFHMSENLTPGNPEIVMGDFNVDLLSRKDDVITRTFSAFEQNIKSSTTRKLTCLDHIYTRHLNAQQADVVPYIPFGSGDIDPKPGMSHYIPCLIAE
jgi:endonuclease/exonuclease/phosphatase family metal-dependent hydrolase